MFLFKLAWRDFLGDKLLWGMSASAVAIGVAIVVASDVVKFALLNALGSTPDAQMIWSGLVDQLESNIAAIGIAIILAAGFIVFNAFSISVARRRRRLATLRSVGMTRGQLIRLTLVEAVFTGIVGLSLGLLIGPLLGRLTIAALIAVTQEGLLAFEPGPPNARSLIQAAAFGLVISVLAAAMPAVQASRVSPIEARRPQEAFGVERSRTQLSWIALGALMLVLITLRLTTPAATLRPPWDFRAAVLLVAFWIGLVLLVTLAAAGVLGNWLRRPLRRFAGASGILIADNLRRARRRVFLTVMSLTIAIALVVGLTGFTRFTFEWLMRPIIERAADLGSFGVTRFDVLAGMAAYKDMTRITLNEDELRTVRRLVGDRAAYMEFRYVPVPELSFFGTSFFSYILHPDEVATGRDWLFKFEQGNWENALAWMEAGCGVLVMPSVASELGGTVGDIVQVTGAEGFVECTMAGIGSSFMTASVIGTTDLNDFAGTGTVLILVDPLIGTDVQTLETDLESLRPELSILEIKDISGASNNLVRQVPIVLNGMAVLAVLAAGLGVLNTLTASVVERRGEFGLFRAIGASRRQLRLVVTGEAAMMAGLGAAIGIVAGLGISVIIPTVYGGSSWGMPDLNHWGAAADVVRPALVNGIVGWFAAVSMGALAGLITAQGMLRRRRLIDELQMEGH